MPHVLQLASWCSTVCTTKHPSTSLTSASLSPVSPLAIVSAVMVSRLFLWPALRYRTGYQTVWEIRSSAETSSSIHWRRISFRLTRVHSPLELGWCALQIYLFNHFEVGAVRRPQVRWNESRYCMLATLYCVMLAISSRYATINLTKLVHHHV